MRKQIFGPCMMGLLLTLLSSQLAGGGSRAIRRWRYSFEGKNVGCLSLIPVTPENPIPSVPLLAGADKIGRFYIVDSSYDRSQRKGALRVYDKSGKEISVFMDERFFHAHHAPYHVACTDGGYIWVGKRLW